ncbi:MAG TPA: outer membrane beta-barrel protein [Terriglobales bacterium]|nr:outer membrane beta-barrel protein [Terriglobales bacterium]
MQLILTLWCAGVVLKERKTLSSQPMKAYFAKFNPVKQRGELIVMNSNNCKSAVETGKRAALVVAATALLTLPLHGQQSAAAPAADGSRPANQSATASSAQTDQEIVQELAAMKKRIEQLEAELKQHVSAEQPTTVQNAKATMPLAMSTPTAAPTAEAEAVLPQTGGMEKPAKAEPFAFADWTWLNGNARTKTPAFDSKFFTPEIRADVDYIYDFNRPKDDTIGGSSEVFRSNEIQLTQLGVGGDFHYDNVRARLMTQFGMYSTTTPRNDASPARGQWNLSDAYRYVSEAYGGYHIDALHGINIDAGIFMSYIGLFSYYNFDNWAYQPSYVSSNTPWFFNGLRVQIFPTAHLKIEPWIINGWQSYGRFNGRLGVGGQILWRPNAWLSVVGNQYALGEDALNTPGRVRYHTDDSVEVKYYDHPEKFLSKAAFSLTGDMGCEHGGGVSCAGNSAKGPKQDFLGFMFYNRFWFHKDMFGFTVGGGKINNPGRYLVLLPPINGATAASGTPYFTENPGDPYKAWDLSETFDYMPSQYITFRWEFDHRAANVPYFSGSGGITPPGGNTGAPGSLVPGFTPDLVKDENRLDLAILVKF